MDIKEFQKILTDEKKTKKDLINFFETITPKKNVEKKIIKKTERQMYSADWTQDFSNY